MKFPLHHTTDAKHNKAKGTSLQLFSITWLEMKIDLISEACAQPYQQITQ